MNVIVVAMVVAVVTLEYSEALTDGDITSEELCQDIKSNARKVLTMGGRGRSQEDAHFYMLVEGGYMFKVPLANLHLDAEKRTTTLTLDREHFRADTLFGVSRDIFSRKHRFFFVSNRNNKDAFLGRLFYCFEHSKSAIQLFDLNGVLSLRSPSKGIAEKYYNKIHVMGSLGIDSTITYGFVQESKLLKLVYEFKVDYGDEFEVTDEVWSGYMMDFSSNTELATVFYHKEDPKERVGYYYFLDTGGLITVTRRKNAEAVDSEFGKSISNLYTNRFEVNLSRFILCRLPSQQTTNVTVGPPSGIPLAYWAIPLGIVILGGIGLYWTQGEHRKKKKDKQDYSNLLSLGSSCISSNLNSSNASSYVSSNASSNASSNSSSKISSGFTLVSNPSSGPNTSSQANSASSVLQSSKSKLTSRLNRNKSKQAKARAKGKKPKVKPKKPKSKV